MIWMKIIVEKYSLSLLTFNLVSGGTNVKIRNKNEEASLVTQIVKNLPTMQEIQFLSLDWENCLKSA